MSDSYVTVENLGKSYGEKNLFSELNFGINKGQKIALVGANGSGKTTLMRIMAGKEPCDNGLVSYRKDLTLSYLPQHPLQDETGSIIDVLFSIKTPLMQAVRNYEEALSASASDTDIQTPDRLGHAIAEMERNDAWTYENQIKEILGKLNIKDIHQRIESLSGGERKKVALAAALISRSDLLLLDEPTNHLDIGMIEWLENILSSSNRTLLIISHDRYFIDNVCTDIYELDEARMNKYHGGFEYYLEKKAERQQEQAAQLAKARNLYKKELEWIRRMPQARGTKSRARIEAFEDLKETALGKSVETTRNFEVREQRIGSKILEINNISKSFDGRCIIDDFSHTYKKGDKIGIIGENGCGKTTLLEIITCGMKPDSGRVVLGQTVRIGYYTQNPPQEKPDTKVIDIIRRVSESIELSNGVSLSASQYLTHFGIPPAKQFTDYSLLSGGEKRLLNLLSVLMANPNFLVLDEPTNDLDIQTQLKLENFLENYKGCLLVVSHDRHFMDSVVSYLFVFQKDGGIKEFPGNYSDYLEYEKQHRKQSPEQKNIEKPVNAKPKNRDDKPKLSYRERIEKEEIEQRLADLGRARIEIEQRLNASDLDNDELNRISEEYKNILEETDLKEMRWLELSEKEG